MVTLGHREVAKPAGMTARELSGRGDSSAARSQESPVTRIRTKLLDDFLIHHPLRSSRLDEIVDALRRRISGTAHVRDLVLELWGDHDLNSIEQAITRQIEDYCSNAPDFNKPKAYDLFERVAPTTYRLRCYPNKPDLLELFHIHFEEPALQSSWLLFAAKAREDQCWKLASNWQKLSAFATKMADEPEMPQHRPAYHTSFVFA